MQLELCLRVTHASCVHCVVVGIVSDCFVLSSVVLAPRVFGQFDSGCVVVTEPFDLTSLVEDTRSPFQIGCTLLLGASVSQHRWAFLRVLVASSMFVKTVHGFADTVRFRGRGLIVDRATSTGHNRVIRGGAVMPFMCRFVPACRQAAHMSTISFWCVSWRTRCERSRYAKGHGNNNITPRALQTTTLHGCLQEACSAWTGFPSQRCCSLLLRV